MSTIQLSILCSIVKWRTYSKPISSGVISKLCYNINFNIFLFRFMVQKGCGTVLMKHYKHWEVLRNVPDITSLDTTILPFIHILQFLLSDTLSIYLITFHYPHYFIVRLLCPVPMFIVNYTVCCTFKRSWLHESFSIWEDLERYTDNDDIWGKHSELFKLCFKWYILNWSACVVWCSKKLAKWYCNLFVNRSFPSFLPLQQGTNEILRMYIALTGMQYAGENLQKLIK